MKKFFIASALILGSTFVFANKVEATHSNEPQIAEVEQIVNTSVEAERVNCKGTTIIDGKEVEYDFGDRSTVGCAWRVAALIFIQAS